MKVGGGLVQIVVGFLQVVGGIPGRGKFGLTKFIIFIAIIIGV
jgi:hypothetical protein